jgi:hypothetical protein
MHLLCRSHSTKSARSKQAICRCARTFPCSKLKIPLPPMPPMPYSRVSLTALLTVFCSILAFASARNNYNLSISGWRYLEAHVQLIIPLARESGIRLGVSRLEIRVFDKNGDIVCCPNGMVCDDSLPYLGPSSSVSASQQTIHVTHTSPPNLPPSSVAGATVSSSSAKDPTIIAGPIRMGGLTAGPTATARGPSTVVIYSEGNSGRMVGVYHLIAVSFWSSAFLF